MNMMTHITEHDVLTGCKSSDVYRFDNDGIEMSFVVRQNTHLHRTDGKHERVYRNAIGWKCTKGDKVFIGRFYAKKYSY
jgi:hypothetical protein